MMVSNRFYVSILTLACLFFLQGCTLSNVVDVSFGRAGLASPEDEMPSSGGLALVVDSNVQTLGQYKFFGAVSNSAPTLIMTSGSYKLYGGLQGQVVSE